MGAQAKISCFDRECDCSVVRWALKAEWAVESATKAWNRRAPLPDNKALTVEELREMDGKWVWVVSEDVEEPVPVKINTAREIAGEMRVEDFPFDCYGEGTDDYYGWLAYRHPPEKGE